MRVYVLRLGRQWRGQGDLQVGHSVAWVAPAGPAFAGFKPPLPLCVKPAGLNRRSAEMAV